MNGMKRMSVAAVAALAMGSAASADTTLQIDLNSLLTTGGGSSFDQNFTGTLSINDDANSTLNDILINGNSQGIASGLLRDVTGSISILSGTVTGGSFSVDAWDTVAQTTFNTYSASIVSGSGAVVPQAGQGWSIDGLTFSGLFSSTTFAGVDVTPWDNAEPLSGSFINFAFSPDSSGSDADSNMDVFVVIPLPSTAGLGFLGLAAIGAQRRRR